VAAQRKQRRAPKRSAPADGEGEALLHQIWKTPEDRALLSVYADWLLAHGDRARGEYMQLALLPTATPAQEARQESLSKRFRGQWLGAARPYIYTWEDSEDSPSFPKTVKCAVKKLAAGFELIRDLAPRLTVSINPVTTSAERALLASLPLGRLYGLGLYESDLGWVNDRLIAALAPKLRGLRRLELSPSPEYYRFTIHGWSALLDAVPTLEELELWFGDSPDPWLDALLRSPLAATLQFITVQPPRGAALRRRLETAFADRVLEIRD
jgi:uncharacterized protein (TIGR02996 family)